MNKLYVFGHTKPDTDSIASAIVFARLQKALGIDAVAYKLGEVNKETKYALKTFEVEEPQTLTSVDENCDVALVDNNEFSQSVSGIEKAHVKMVVDHHKIKLETVEPIYFITEPLGCTCTILYKLYKQNEVDIDSQTAGLMLSAIISDTLLFKSPTCTEQDKEIAKKLAKIAGVDIESYGKENIPKEDGFMFFPNHQGMYDVLAIIDACDNTFSVVAKKEVANVPLLKQTFACTKSYMMDREDIRQSMQVIMNVANDVKNGKNFLIFPEGTRSKNGNVIGEFKGGSFKAATKARCPIVPVALIDSFKPFDTNTISQVTVQVHFMEPLYYEDYKDMKTTEIASTVHDRIQKKINENIG